MGVFKYKKSFEKLADKYIDSKTDTFANGKIKVSLPTIEDFAINFLHVSRRIVYDWEKDYPKFARVLDQIRQAQKQRLIEEGLVGNYNPALAKFLLSANHDMREKSDVTTDDEPINNFNDEQANRIAERVARRKKANDNQPVT